MSTAQFKVGSVYRDAAGRIQRLSDKFYDGRPCESGEAWSQVFEDGKWYGDGVRFLADGSDPSGVKLGLKCFSRDLLPGELTLKDGEWVAVEETKTCGCEEWACCEHCRPEYLAHLFPAKPAQTAPEPKRAPLDWNKSTPFDPFPGFHAYSDAVSSGFVETKQAQRHPLQSSPDLESQWEPFKFGSASLKQG